MAPRLKTSIRVAAYAHRLEADGAFVTHLNRGDPDAGAIVMKLILPGGTIHDRPVRALAEERDETGEAVWRDCFGGPTDEARLDAWLTRELARDPDLWALEVDDPAGRCFLSAVLPGDGASE